VHVKNPKHPTAILTCWTKKDSVIKQLEEAGVDYNSVGQLYTTRGISPFVRNLLANRYIKRVVLVGKDLSKVGQQLIKMWSNMTMPSYTTTANLCGCSDIPKEQQIAVVGTVVIYYGCDHPDTLDNLIRNGLQHHEPFQPSDKKAYSYPEPVAKTSMYPSADFGHTVTGRTIPEVYLKMLQYILRFGKETDTHYGDPQKEVFAMQNVITDHLPIWCHEEDGFHKDEVPDWMPENTEHVETYVRERILSGMHYPDLKYTYGELIHAFPHRRVTHDDPLVTDGVVVNQFQLAVRKMVEDPNQRSCVVSLWDPTKHTAQKSGTPCLNHLQFRIRDDVLTLHAFIRSNDMFAGWSANAYALRVLQEEFIYRYLEEKEDCAVAMGPLCITSMSAHLYRDTWEAAKELVDGHLWNYAKKPQSDWDPKGQFEARKEDGKLVVTLTDGEQELYTWRANTAKGMCNKIAKDVVTSNISNVMFLARELMRLEAEE
jgi:thymidylate synthase